MRKPILVLGSALVLAAGAAVFAGSHRRAPYRFVEGAEPIADAIVSEPSGRLVRYRIYNLHRSASTVMPAIDSELTANGWGPFIRSSYMTMWSKRPKSPSKLASVAFMAMALDGRAELNPKARAPLDYDRDRTVEGWTAVYIYEEYEPGFIGSIVDRFARPPTLKGESLKALVAPSAAALKSLPTNSTP